jgi:hypothetical protein
MTLSAPAASYLTVIGTSLLVGVGLCYALVTIGGSTELPWAKLFLVATISAITGLAICLLIAVLGRVTSGRIVK